MQKYDADYTNTFRSLTLDCRKWSCLNPAEFLDGVAMAVEIGQLQETAAAVEQLMKEHNPAVVPPGHRVEEHWRLCRRRLFCTETVLSVLTDPYAYTLSRKHMLPRPAFCTAYRTFAVPNRAAISLQSFSFALIKAPG